MTVARQRLVDVERGPKRAATCTDLVPVDRGRCLRCRGELRKIVFGQPALFRSHGHGAVLQTTIEWCVECDWTFVADVTEVRPERQAS